MDIKKLIEDVITALANNFTLDSVSSRVQVISRLLKNDRFRKWVDCEFVHGYKSDEETPEYRIMYIAGVRASYVAPAGFGSMVKYTNQQIPIENLGAERYKKIAKIYVWDTVSIIQNAIKPDEDIYLAVGPHESADIQEVLGHCQIMNMYKVVSSQQYQRIVDKTKATLIDFFLELNETILDNEIDFNVMTKKNDIERIVNNTIYASVVNTGEGSVAISDSTVVGGKDNQVSISSDVKQQLNNIISQIEALAQEVDDDRTDIAEAIIAVKEELNADRIHTTFLRLAFNAIKGAISGLADTGIEKLAEQAIKLLQ